MSQTSSHSNQQCKKQTHPKSQSTEIDIHQKYGQQYSFQQYSQISSQWMPQSKQVVALKQNFSSINSQTSQTAHQNITFACTDKNRNKNLAYMICAKYPAKIKKQVQQIISYYQNQLQSQRSLFWRTVQAGKCKKNKQNLQLLNRLSQNQQDTKSVSQSDKNRKINCLEQKLGQKDHKIAQLNRQLMIMRSKYENIKIQMSPTRSKRLSQYDLRQ